MNQESEQKSRERRNETLKKELLQAVIMILNPYQIRVYTVENKTCHLQTDVQNEFHIMQRRFIEVISKIIANNK